jgi:hypothetical protein
MTKLIVTFRNFANRPTIQPYANGKVHPITGHEGPQVEYSFFNPRTTRRFVLHVLCVRKIMYLLLMWCDNTVGNYVPAELHTNFSTAHRVA